MLVYQRVNPITALGCLPSSYPLVMTNIAMERSTMLLMGKVTISMGHGFHGYVK